MKCKREVRHQTEAFQPPPIRCQRRDHDMVVLDRKMGDQVAAAATRGCSNKRVFLLTRTEEQQMNDKSSALQKQAQWIAMSRPLLDGGQGKTGNVDYRNRFRGIQRRKAKGPARKVGLTVVLRETYVSGQRGRATHPAVRVLRQQRPEVNRLSVSG